jgi:DNA-binding CsgD family transcriptional regulator
VLERFDSAPGEMKARIEGLSAEYDNVRLAMDWAAAEDGDLEAVMVERLRWYWQIRGSHEACDRILSAVAKEPADPATRARLHIYAAGWLSQADDFEKARLHYAQAVVLVQELDDPELSLLFYQRRAFLEARVGNLDRAAEDAAIAVGVLDRVPASHRTAVLLNGLALIRSRMGHSVDALDLIEQAIIAHSILPDPEPWFSSAIANRGDILLRLNRIGEARTSFLRSLEGSAEYGMDYVAIGPLWELARMAAAAGQAAVCLELLAAAHRCERLAGGTPETVYAAVNEAERVSRSALGPKAAQEAWTRGLRMDLHEALERARAGTQVDSELPLTPRKTEIVRLVAAGLSNKEIAQHISISERTVEAHLDQVRNQLGLNNRAQVAAWAVARGLAVGLP